MTLFAPTMAASSGWHPSTDSMKLDFRGFTSKVARRAFFVFIACALLPISVLAFISLRQVTSELRTQSERRMRQAAKSTGLLLHQRILALDPSLEPVTPPASPAFGPTRPRPFIGVTLVTEDGRSQPVFGEVKSLPVFTAEQQRHVAAGEKLLSTHLSPAGPHRRRRQDAGGDHRGRLAVRQRACRRDGRAAGGGAPTGWRCRPRGIAGRRDCTVS